MYIPSPPKPPPRFNNAWKHPDIEHCPCCSASTARHAIPHCIDQIKCDRKLMDFQLQWVCDCCGCEWLHGQFEKTTTEEK
jgi:hypothetical protein